LTGRCSPVPSRECCSIFLTMASARLPCCTTFSRSPRSVFINSVISPRLFSFGLASSSTSCNSSINSAESAEKLFTKLSGFLISCAIPAVSWPSEASFCVWTSRSCVVRRSSSDFARCARLHFVEQTDIRDRDHAWSAKISTSSIWFLPNGSTRSRDRNMALRLEVDKFRIGKDVVHISIEIPAPARRATLR
jgi:hypothetical protein